MLTTSPRSCWMANALCKYQTTSATTGRRPGFCSKQRWVKSHNPSFKIGSFGRSGLSPDRTLATTELGVLSANGAAPVKSLYR